MCVMTFCLQCGNLFCLQCAEFILFSEEDFISRVRIFLFEVHFILRDE